MDDLLVTMDRPPSSRTTCSSRWTTSSSRWTDPRPTERPARRDGRPPRHVGPSPVQPNDLLVAMDDPASYANAKPSPRRSVSLIEVERVGNGSVSVDRRLEAKTGDDPDHAILKLGIGGAHVDETDSSGSPIGGDFEMYRERAAKLRILFDAPRVARTNLREVLSNHRLHFLCVGPAGDAAGFNGLPDLRAPWWASAALLIDRRKARPAAGEQAIGRITPREGARVASGLRAVGAR